MYEEYSQVDGLPRDWDQCVRSNTHLSRANLEVLERTNPCSQRYVAFFDQNGAVDSALVLYRLKLNLLTYSSMRLPVNASIVGVPCSVASPGFVAGRRTQDELVTYLEGYRGLVIILNSDGELHLPQWTRGATLPSCHLRLNFASYEEFLSAMRSHYRYRYRVAARKGAALQVHKLESNRDFGPDLFDLYSQVFEKSSFKLERLNASYFREADAEVHVFSAAGSPAGFVQLRQVAGEMQFLFGGMDYGTSGKYDTYVNMLLFIVREAIARGCTSVDFGQTAEDTKCKLGCQLQPRYMYVRHSASLINHGIGKLMKSFEYRAPGCDFRVFSEQGGRE